MNTEERSKIQKEWQEIGKYMGEFKQRLSE